MFVRFRQQHRRLQASLMQTRRVAGKMQSEHIASLGTVDADVSVGEAIAMVRKSKHEDEFGVEFAIANWDMQRTQSYVELGRQFENATDEDLQALFVQAFRDWRANLWGDGRQSRVVDVSAKYTLRGVDPPYALVEDDLLEIGP